MLIYAMSASVDGFITDRGGGLDWSVPDEELFRFHTERVRELSGCLLGRKLYEAMIVWDTDPSLSADEKGAAFADAWCSIPKVVFSDTLDGVQGNARLAAAPLAAEAAAACSTPGNHVQIGGADLAAQAIELGLLDELCVFRHPVVLGGGTPLLPPVSAPLSLELIETRTFASAVVYERYRCPREDAGGAAARE